MVSIVGLTEHYKQAFTEQQAKVLVEGAVQIEHDLVKREDFSRLTAAMERLAVAQQETKQELGKLAVAHQQTQQELRQLAVDQQETKQELRKLAVAQQETQQELKQLAIVQQRNELEIHELFVAQKELTWTVKDIHKQLGGLSMSVGHGLEAYCMERIPRILADFCGFKLKSSVPETIYADDRGDEIDVVCRGTIAGRPAVVLCEVKTNITVHEIREFMQVFDRVRPTVAAEEGIAPADVHPLFFGYRASPEARRMIAETGASLAFPRGMIAGVTGRATLARPLTPAPGRRPSGSRDRG